MRRPAAALLLVGTFVSSLLLVAGVGFGYSDGIAGSSGAIEERLRECQGVPYCKVRPAYCGGCHGQYEEMWQQEDSHPTPQEQVRADFRLNGDAKAGLRDGTWEYTPGQSFLIDIRLDDTRPRGTWNSGGFNLNASGGALSLFGSDGLVRITGGTFQHAGSKDPRFTQQGVRYGAVEVDESAWAGEATQTSAGAETRAWRVRWTAPAAGGEPRGAALVMTAMLPNGDAIDTCTRVECNGSKPYKPQSEWDWYGFLIPRRILCERGAYDSYADCSKAVLAFILPPAPPVATSCAAGDVDCPTASGGPTDASEPPRRSGAASPLAAACLLAAVALALRARRRG